MKLKELNYERFILSTRPVLWLPLYRKGGATFLSSDAYGHVATVTGATWGSQGRTFDGDDYIDFGSGTSLNNLSSFTWEMWVKPTTINSDHWLLAKRHTKNLEITGTGNLFVYAEKAGAGTSPTSTSSTLLSTGNWYQIIVTYNDVGDRKFYIYVNGVEVAYSIQTAAVNALSDDSSYNFRFGHYQDAVTYFIGIGGEVLIYNRALSTQEITQIYNATKWRYQ